MTPDFNYTLERSPGGDSRLHATETRPRVCEPSGKTRLRSAVSDGQWKLIVTATSVELYNLAEDSGEKNDLATKHPELVRKLRAHLEAQSAKDNDAVPN